MTTLGRLFVFMGRDECSRMAGQAQAVQDLSAVPYAHTYDMRKHLRRLTTGKLDALSGTRVDV